MLDLPDAAAPWLLRIWPAEWRPYLQLARIDRPIGWQLLLLPCWWSSALATDVGRGGLNLLHLALFFLGAVAMRGAGSTFNDIVDRNIDRKVARTRGRPIASGAVSVKAATAFLVAQALVGAAVLFSLNTFSILLGLGSLVLVALYPFAKRVTHWPQAMLGLAFAYGGLMGWAAEFGTLTWPPALLYGCAIFWTIGYDTIYALQDTTDDAVIGIGSTALYFGDQVRPGVAVIYAAAVACATLALVTAGAGVAAFAGCALFAAHLASQILRLDRTDDATARHLFRGNRNAGLLFFAGLAIDALLR